MVGTTDSSSNHHTPPPHAVDNNSQLRKNLPSPWAQIVRGVEPESSAAGARQSPPLPSSSPSPSIAAPAPDLPMSNSSCPKAITVSPAADHSSSAVVPPDTSDSGDGNAGLSKRPAAWNNLPNGAIAVVSAASWPTPSETTKAHGKFVAESSSSSSFKVAVVDGSLSITSEGPVTSHTPQRQVTSHTKPSPATNYHAPNRQRSVKRGGGGNIGPGHAQSSFSNPPPPPPSQPFSVYQFPTVSYGNVVPGVLDHSPRDHYLHNNWDAMPLVGGFVPAMSEHRGSSRRGNFGPHPRGDGSSHNNYGSRCDQDHGNYVNIRDAHVHQPRIPPGRLLRHPPPNIAFVGSQPIGPFANQMGIPDHYFPTVPLEHFRGIPLYTQSPHPPMHFPAAELAPLSNMIACQIEYYFSDDNLVKDEFLRSYMDEQGWVPVTLIAEFPRVKQKTSNIQMILDSLRTSTVVEVQGDKLRRQNEWMKWLPVTADSGGSRFNKLASHLQFMEGSTNDEGLT